MNRRSFLTSILAACAAPAIVRADSLMRIIPTDTWVFGMPPAHIPVDMLQNAWGVETLLKRAIYIPSAMELYEIDKLMYPDKPSRCVKYVDPGFKVTSAGIIADGGHLGTYFGDPKLITAWRKR